MSLIKLENIKMIYRSPLKKLPSVMDINLEINHGEFVCIAGKPGCGSTNLLKLIRGEIVPDKGTVYLEKYNLATIGKLKQRQVDVTYGTVWQEYSFDESMTVFQTFFKDAKSASKASDEEILRLNKALSLVGMSGFENKELYKLNDSDKCRLNIAIAIYTSPPILLIDDVFERINEEQAWDIINLLRELNRRGITVIMAAHSGKYINMFRPRVVVLNDGKIQSDTNNGSYGGSITL